MTDLLFIAIIIVFFLLAIGYLSGCAALRQGGKQ